MPNSDERSIAYSYLRFSSPAQAEGDSVRRQTALRDAWLKRNPEVRLDTSLTLVDAGVSGYTGGHRKNAKNALAQFLALVERGRVPVGSYLIVENLDRLTREEPEDSIPMVLNLIKAGVRVVQLAPTEMVYEPGMDFGRLMMMLYELARGHGESKRKSGLCGEAWMDKKKQARNDKTPYGSMCPAWLEIVGVKRVKGDKSYHSDFSEASYRLKADAAATVRKIFQWCAEGLGTFAILKRLNEEGIPAFGRSGRWERSTLKKILGNRAVLGEYQPHKGSRGPSRVPDGEAIIGFYPKAIEEALWHAAQQATKGRARRSGRPATGSNNPFSGLLFDAFDGEKLHVSGTRGYKYLVSSGALQKVKGSQWRTFPMDTFRDGILSMLRELKATELFSDPGAEKVTTLQGRLSEVEKRLAVALARFDADPESPTWAEKVSQFDREKRALVKELAEARVEAANPLSGNWAEAVQLMAENEPERLRAALIATVEGMWCVFVGRGKTRIAWVQVVFRSAARRDFLLLHRGGNGGAVGDRPAVIKVESKTQSPVPLDLRRPEDARKLEVRLVAVSLENLAATMRDLTEVEKRDS